MPPAIIAAAIGGGAALISSSNAKKANNQAIEAQSQATAQQIAAQQAALDKTTALNQPFINGGQAAYNKLLQQYGIGTPAPANNNAAYAAPAPTAGGAVAGTGAGMATQGGPVPTGTVNDLPALDRTAPAPGAQPQSGGQTATGLTDAQLQGYLNANPDVANSAWLKGIDPSVIGDQDGNGVVNDLDRAAYHYAQYGQADGHGMPAAAATPAGATQPAANPNDLMNANRPDQLAVPNTGAAPNSADYFSNFQQSPGYQFILDQATRGANAGYAGRGLLKSDSAVKGIMGQASGLAAQDYNNWWSQQNQLLQGDRGQYNADRTSNLNVWDTQNTNQNNNFNTDRQYQTNQFNTNTGNVFSLANMGIQAAGNVSGANSNFAANSGNIYGSQADAASAAAANNAAANNYAVGGLAGAAKNIFGVGNNNAGLNADLAASAAYKPNLF